MSDELAASSPHDSGQACSSHCASPIIWGGEEFIVLAANRTQDDGAQLAERLRAHVEVLDFGEPGWVTISVGVAEWRKGDTRKALVARADEAMYLAKKMVETVLNTECWGLLSRR
jgi:diguanylate cyclase (GGDEF)-like protein